MSGFETGIDIGYIKFIIYAFSLLAFPLWGIMYLLNNVFFDTSRETVSERKVSLYLNRVFGAALLAIWLVAILFVGVCGKDYFNPAANMPDMTEWVKDKNATRVPGEPG